MRVARAGVAVILVLVGACGGTPGSAVRESGWSVLSAIGSLPAVPPSDTVRVIQTADLARATALAGLTVPSPGDTEAIGEWLGTLTLGRDIRGDELTRVAVPAPLEPLLGTYGFRGDEFAPTLGFWMAAIDSFAEVSDRSIRVTVLTGEFDQAALSAALGEPVDGVRTLDTESSDFAGEVARFFQGTVAVAARDGQIALADSAGLAQSWGGSGTRMSADPVLASVASALDSHDVYAAMLLPNAARLGSLDSDPEQLPSEFTTVGIGVALRDGTPLMVLTYAYPDAAKAESNADVTRSLIESRPDLFRLVEIGATGDLVTAVVQINEDTPRVAWQLLWNFDPLLQHN